MISDTAYKRQQLRILNTINQGDCVEIMSLIPDLFVDCIISDPPYGIGYDKWDKLNNDWLNQAYRVLKENGTIWCFAGWSNVGEVKKEIEKKFTLRNWVIWDRQKGRGAKYNFVSTREDILWATKSDDYTFNRLSSNIEKKTKGMGLKNGDKYRKLSNVWTDISPIVPWSKERVKHPTQKPLDLIKRLVAISTNKDEIVFDPFIGSGTTAVACKELGRYYIGIEINPEYCQMAEQRLAQEILFSNLPKEP